ncbi:MAG: hypothetical protein ACREBR_00395 [bacterium]
MRLEIKYLIITSSIEIDTLFALPWGKGELQDRFQYTPLSVLRVESTWRLFYGIAAR